MKNLSDPEVFRAYANQTHTLTAREFQMLDNEAFTALKMVIQDNDTRYHFEAPSMHQATAPEKALCSRCHIFGFQYLEPFFVERCIV